MKVLVIVVGLPWSKKLEYVNEKFSNYQIISSFCMRKSMEFTRINKTDESLYLITEVMARSLMILKRPIVVVEESMELESIFIWKKMAVEHGYVTRVIVLDTPLEECFAKAEKRDKVSLQHIAEESKKLEQLKQILNMEHQKIVDELKIVKVATEEKRDEVLQD